jgi:hypothetical protein
LIESTDSHVVANASGPDSLNVLRMNADRMLFEKEREKKSEFRLQEDQRTGLTDIAPGGALATGTKQQVCLLRFRHRLANVRRDRATTVEMPSPQAESVTVSSEGGIVFPGEPLVKSLVLWQ